MYKFRLILRNYNIFYTDFNSLSNLQHSFFKVLPYIEVATCVTLTECEYMQPNARCERKLPINAMQGREKKVL